VDLNSVFVWACAAPVAAAAESGTDAEREQRSIRVWHSSCAAVKRRQEL